MHLDQVRNDIDELVQALLFFTQPYHPVFERSYRKRQEQQEGYRSDDDIGFIPHIPPYPTDLDKQKALTDLLFSMQPVYDSCEKDMTNFLELISSMMKAPIAMTSFGPTALEKDFFNHQLSTAQNTELFAFL